MPRRDITLVAGNYYHVFNRGCNRQAIFFDRDNYGYFLRGTRKYLMDDDSNGSPQLDTPVEIHAYCLMPNHFHLLVYLKCDDFSSRMASLGQSYSNAINKRFRRVRPLFQSRFRAVLVDDEGYLVHLSRYIHLNPVIARLVQKAQEWEFSSYADYIGIRQGTLPCKEVILREFSGADAYRQFVESRLELIRSGMEKYLLD